MYPDSDLENYGIGIMEVNPDDIWYAIFYMKNY